MPKSNYTHRNNIFAFAMSLHASWYILVSFPSFWHVTCFQPTQHFARAKTNPQALNVPSPFTSLILHSPFLTMESPEDSVFSASHLHYRICLGRALAFSRPWALCGRALGSVGRVIWYAVMEEVPQPWAPWPPKRHAWSVPTPSWGTVGSVLDAGAQLHRCGRKISLHKEIGSWQALGMWITTQ